MSNETLTASSPVFSDANACAVTSGNEAVLFTGLLGISIAIIVIACKVRKLERRMNNRDDEIRRSI